MQVEYTRMRVNGSPANALEDNTAADAAGDLGNEPVVMRGGGDVTHSEARTGLPPAGNVSSGGFLQGLLNLLSIFCLFLT
jgi:hypothetical protein